MSQPLAVLTLASLAILIGCERPIETIRASGDFQFEHGDYAAAAPEYAEITARYPGDWQAHYRLGQSLLEIGKPAEARHALEIAHSRRPHDSHVADALAEAMYQQGDETRLFAFLRERAESTQNVEAYLRLARYAVDLSDPDSAKVALEAAIEFDDGRTVEPYLEAAAFALRLGDVDLALRRLRQAYSVSPRDNRVRQRIRDLGEVPGPTLALPPGN